MVSNNKPRLLLFLTSGLLTTALVNAQDASCQNRQRFESVNSTGQHEFAWNSSYASDDPWYVSVLVGSQGTEWSDSHDVRANAYISVPKHVSNGTEICTYQYSNINATLQSGGVDSCSGLISSTCIDHLTKVLTISATYCPDSDTGSTSEAFNQACPMLKGGSHTSKFVDVTNSTCDYPSISDLQIPDKYNTFGTVMGIEASDTTANVNANTTYDLLTRQTIPIVLLARIPDPKSNLVQSSVQFVCMTANKTVEGSRVAEQGTPWESAGAKPSGGMVGWAAGVLMLALMVL